MCILFCEKNIADTYYCPKQSIFLFIYLNRLVCILLVIAHLKNDIYIQCPVPNNVTSCHCSLLTKFESFSLELLSTLVSVSSPPYLNEHNVLPVIKVGYINVS